MDDSAGLAAPSVTADCGEVSFKGLAQILEVLLADSISAGATKIRIETEYGGRRLMRVTDDGESPLGTDQIQSSLARLTRLAKIADVAEVEVRSWSAEGHAEILIIKTNDREFVPTNRTTAGVSVTLRNLYSHIPSNRRPVESGATEVHRIKNAVTRSSLLRPEISFSLLNDGRELISLSPARSRKERVFQLFGRELAEGLLRIEEKVSASLSIEGFISTPRERRTSPKSQFIFINGRASDDPTVSAGLREGYRNVMFRDFHPFAIVFVDASGESALSGDDSKYRKFRDPEQVRSLIASATRAALERGGISTDIH